MRNWKIAACAVESLVLGALVAYLVLAAFKKNPPPPMPDFAAFSEVKEKKKAFIDFILKRVDIIPPSLALAQAANESGWGTSRFARLGYNLYGIWCYQPGCGIAPLRRNPHARYEVKKYEGVAACVSDYINQLNTDPAYQTLRAIRAQKKKFPVLQWPPAWTDIPLEGPLMSTKSKPSSESTG